MVERAVVDGGPRGRVPVRSAASAGIRRDESQLAVARNDTMHQPMYLELFLQAARDCITADDVNSLCSRQDGPAEPCQAEVHGILDGGRVWGPPSGMLGEAIYLTVRTARQETPPTQVVLATALWLSCRPKDATNLMLETLVPALPRMISAAASLGPGWTRLLMNALSDYEPQIAAEHAAVFISPSRTGLQAALVAVSAGVLRMNLQRLEEVYESEAEAVFSAMGQSIPRESIGLQEIESHIDHSAAREWTDLWEQVRQHCVKVSESALQMNL